LSVDQINVRGSQIPFANWYYDSNPTQVTVANFQAQLNFTGTATSAYRTANPTVPSGMMQSYGGAVPAGCAISPTQFYINEFGLLSSNPTMCFTQASGPISLKPGDRAIVYFQVPAGILSTVDAGSQTSVSIYAGNVGAPQSVTVASKS